MIFVRNKVNKRNFLLIVEVKMVDVVFVGQLIDSMEGAIFQLDEAISNKRLDDANKLRTFIYDLYSHIDKELEVKNV